MRNRSLPAQLPRTRPFRVSEALDRGISRREVDSLWEHGVLRRVVRGVFADADLPDTLELRVTALALVIPPGVVITDRTAAWLHGVDLLPRTDHDTVVPDVQCFSVEASRVRRRQVASGTRQLRPDEILHLGNLRVTAPLRTALDLGRLLPKHDALAALDGFLRLGVSINELLLGSVQMRGMRGVRQLRALASIADARAESPAESALRLHWIEADLPTPAPQFPVRVHGRDFRLDIADPKVRFAAEYDGQAYHGLDRAAHDARRRELLRSAGWTVAVFTAEDVYGRRDAWHRLRTVYREALATRQGLIG